MTSTSKSLTLQRMSDERWAEIVELREHVLSRGAWSSYHEEFYQALTAERAIVERLKVLPEILQDNGWSIHACEVVNTAIERIINPPQEPKK